MPIFYFHPVDRVPQQLSEMMGVRGFQYTNRGELDFKIQKLLIEADYYIDPRFHTILGSLAGSIDKHIPLNPDDALDRHTLLVCKNNNPWSYLKINNGRQMMLVVGYCSSAATSPFALGVTEMAQRGIINATHVPRPV